MNGSVVGWFAVFETVASGGLLRLVDMSGLIYFSFNADKACSKSARDQFSAAAMCISGTAVSRLQRPPMTAPLWRRMLLWA